MLSTYIFIAIFLFLKCVGAENKAFVFTDKMAQQCKELICSEGKNYKYFYSVDSDNLKAVRKDSDTAFEMHIGIQAVSDGHILLSPTPTPGPDDPVYEIVFGSSANQNTVLRRNFGANTLASTDTPDILSSSEVRGFYIKISRDGLIELGKEGEVLPLLTYTDANLLEIKYYSFAAWSNIIVKFLYDCLMAPPKIISNSTTVKGIEGDLAMRIPCDVVGIPQPVITWKLNGASIKPDAKYSIENGALVIMNPKKEDSNKTYTCEAKNYIGPVSTTFQTIVEAPPKIISNSTTVKGIEGDLALRIPCDVVGIPQPVITWKLNGASIKPEAKYSIENGALVIMNPKKEDSNKTYTCEAKNYIGSVSTTFQTIVEAPPKIISNSTTVKGIEGDLALRIPCDVVGIPQPVITWKLNGASIKPDAKYSIENGALVIMNPKKEDSNKTYTCEAKNYIGSVSTTFQTIVEAPPKIISNSTTVKGIEGDLALRIPCDVVGIPQPVITWKLNGASIKPDAKYSIENGALVIMNPKKEDSNKTYTCEAKNYIGSVSTTFQTIVEAIPDSDQLKKSILLHRLPWIPPKPTMDVKLGIKVTNVKYDVFQSKLITAVSVVTSWADESMAWNPVKFNGTVSLEFRQGQIWKPKFYIINSDNEVAFDASNSDLISMVYSGEATFHFQTKVYTWCVDSSPGLSNWPRDEYLCSIVIQPWEAHEIISIDIIDPKDSKMQIFSDIDEVINNEWEVSTEQEVIKPAMWNKGYTSDDNQTHQSDRLIINVQIKRRATAYNIVFYTPLIVLMWFVLMSFWSEPLTMSRIWFLAGCTIVMCVGLCYIDDMIPSHTLPFILVLYTTVLSGVLLALLIQALLMANAMEKLRNTATMQKVLTAKICRTIFCLPTYLTPSDRNRGCAIQENEEPQSISLNKDVEEMETENQRTFGDKKELAEVIDRILFVTYFVTFAALLALHF